MQEDREFRKDALETLSKKIDKVSNITHENKGWVDRQIIEEFKNKNKIQ